ncbi:MAG: ABC transporter permease subunit [Candidatus Hydrogenedens sp.]|jgi:ABC-type transport system involved in multi-copper enzyme maturation permease subunit|nr:ABC transporter permease subunit [Candidatus Hydrogenedens sp.]
MRNTLSILRRDLGTYFTSPIGYIFIMVFVTMSVGLYVTSFFLFPVADMRPYFENLPLLLCVFIPAVTMRIWAEERKENTWEMLLTFPMQAWELTIGKFLAALAFYAVTLLATFTVPMMLFSLGNPDGGVVMSGYFGTLLLGACFLALGILFSGFFKDQIVAFVVTLLSCFLFFLLGTDFFASYIDSRIAGLGSMLADLFGIFTHYQPLVRGVIDLSDVLFFVIWTVLFLTLNIIFIDGRNRPRARTMFAVITAICLVIGMLFNYLLAGSSIKRFDMTEDKIYTVSPSSKAILQEATSEIEVKLYITPRDKMPTAMRNMERDITDKLEELRLASGGRLNFATVYLEAANAITTGRDFNVPEEDKDNEEEAIEKRMLDKGVEPFNVQAMSEDQVTNQLIYSSIGIGYEAKAEEIIPQIMPNTLPDLEYQLVNTIYKLTRDEQPVVALVAPKEAVNIDPQMRQMLMQMGQPVPETEDPYIYLEQVLQMEKYQVERVELTKEDPLPEEYDTLAIINPRSLDERQRWEINRAVHSGKSVIIAAQQYEWEYQATREGNRITRRDENPLINDLLEKYGLGVSTDVLMDTNNVTLNVQSQSGGLFGALMGQPFTLPTHILVNNQSMNQDKSITNRLAAILYLWGTAVTMDDAKLKDLNLETEILMSSSSNAWSVGADQPMTQSSFDPPSSGQAYPLMIMAQGQFPDAYADMERPAWPKAQPQPGMPPEPEDDDDEGPAPAVSAAPGKLILLGCSEMFKKNFLQAANLDLFLNSVDAVTLSENLVNVRGTKAIDRLIDRPTGRQRTLWQLTNYGLANIIIAAVGISSYILRRRSRNAYTMAQYRAATSKNQ